MYFLFFSRGIKKEHNCFPFTLNQKYSRIMLPFSPSKDISAVCSFVLCSQPKLELLVQDVTQLWKYNPLFNLLLQYILPVLMCELFVPFGSSGDFAFSAVSPWESCCLLFTIWTFVYVSVFVFLCIFMILHQYDAFLFFDEMLWSWCECALLVDIVDCMVNVSVLRRSLVII